MLRNHDRHAQPAARRLTLGQRARFPLSTYDLHRTTATHTNRDWVIVGFPLAPSLRHAVTIERAHDRQIKTISQHLWLYHAERDDHRDPELPNRSRRRRQGTSTYHRHLTSYRRFLAQRAAYLQAQDAYWRDPDNEEHRNRYRKASAAYYAGRADWPLDIAA